MNNSHVDRVVATLLVLVLSAMLVSCARSSDTGGSTVPTPPDSLPVTNSGSANLVSVPWTLQQLDTNRSALTLSYSYGGCQAIPSGVEVTQADKDVVVALMAPKSPGHGVCTPNLVVGTSEVTLPALNGRSVLHASTSR
ncbi:MAG TPA: hypothetical protein VGL06_18375 [Pseudonocardiaceae bacterium]|jgi:hypothetical protein